MKGRKVLISYDRLVACVFVLASIMVYHFPRTSRSLLANCFEHTQDGKGISRFFGSVDYSVPFPVYYINLDRSEDRRKRTEFLFGDLWDLRRSPAVAGTDSGALLGLLGNETYQRKASYIQRERYNDEAVAWNEAATTLSHLITIRKAYLENHDMVMIVEDDLSPALM